jgi:hypothetical protein
MIFVALLGAGTDACGDPVDFAAARFVGLVIGEDHYRDPARRGNIRVGVEVIGWGAEPFD